MDTNNKIDIIGSSNNTLQNITARDIIIHSGTEANPEIKAEKQKIAEQIANLVQIVSLRTKEDESDMQNKTFDEDDFEDIDFEELTKAVKNGNCVLFIGPEISVDENSESIHENFYKKISNKKRKFIEKEGLFMPGAETRLINVSKDFYKDVFQSLNTKAGPALKKLAQIPFKLIVSLTPDDTIHQIFDNYNIKHNFLYYTGTKNEDLIIDKEYPTIYNALGSARENGRYIYTHKQFNDYIKTDIEAKFPFEIEDKIKNEETTHYLFIGFNFNKWYYKLLMYELNLLSDIESYSFDAEKTDIPNRDFINKQFDVSFIDVNYNDFTTLLLQKSKKGGFTKSLDKVFVNSILEELEAIRVETVDSKELGELKELQSKIQVINEKINRS